MRVRMKETVGSFETGREYDVQADFGKGLVAGGKASHIDKPTEKADVPTKTMKKEQVKRRASVA